mmetsp:Transcript_9575/g.15712  ORF Transcript_9575/g.15712 Transcript_9575/m.15712 type:complete len:507 (+) Transcript_9575:61-1581(+)
MASCKKRRTSRGAVVTLLSVPPSPCRSEHIPSLASPISRTSASVSDTISSCSPSPILTQASPPGAVPCKSFRLGSRSRASGSGFGPAGPQPSISARDAKTAPLRKVTSGLIAAYKHINEVYYARKRKRTTEAKSYDYTVKSGEVWMDRYVVEKVLGKGSFGQVVRALDKKSMTQVAIKIVKKRKPFLVQAQSEIKILETISRLDGEERFNMVRILDHFVHKEHQCIVFELLSHNLWDLLRNTDCEGVSLNLVKKFGRQILEALAFLALPQINIVHCDLKPENILLRNPKRSLIKIIDFGSSCKADERIHTYIQSRFYRAPEIMLKLPYTVAIDMWSLGCILCELHTGVPLFQGDTEHDQMARIVEVLGLPPSHMIEKSDRASHFFVQESDSSWSLRPVQNRMRTIPGTRALSDVLGVYTGGPKGKRKGQPGHDSSDYHDFHDILQLMLTFDTSSRISPLQALQHPFFSPSSSEAPSSPAPIPSKFSLLCKNSSSHTLSSEEVPACR